LIATDDSIIYDGDWLNDQYHGEGKLNEAKYSYVGHFVKGRKSGKG
jgi:hypothetical protein